MGGLGGMEMGGGGSARRAIPTHRKERDEWGTRLYVRGLIEERI
jgi:hypothetical protein